MGSLHFCLSTISSTIVSAWYDNTAFPVLFVMGACCIASLLMLGKSTQRCDHARFPIAAEGKTR
jgi:hypothetical protein